MDVELKNDILTILGRMEGAWQSFASAGLGYFDYDFFDWKGNRWGVRFLAKVRKSYRAESPTYGWIHGPRSKGIEEDREKRLQGFKPKLPAVKAGEIEEDREKSQLVAEHKGIRARFNLSKCIRKLPSGRLGAFESFQTEIDGTYYWGSFLVIEKPYPEDKPLSWDSSRGARGGIPTLGKKR